MSQFARDGQNNFKNICALLEIWLFGQFIGLFSKLCN